MLTFNTKNLIAVLSAFVVVLMLCETSSAVRARKHRPPVNDRWSFQITSDNRTDDDDFHGIRLSLKHHNSKNSAIRFNLGFTGRDEHRPTQGVIYKDGMAYHIDESPRFDFTGVNLSVQYLFYPRPRRGLNFFWGVGPRLSVSESDPDILLIRQVDFPYNSYEEIPGDKTHLVGAGLEGSIGVEWYLGRSFSILGEYGLSLEHRWYVIDLDYYDQYGYERNEVETIDDGTYLDASQIKLGVAYSF